MKKRNHFIHLIWLFTAPFMLIAQDAKLEVEDGAVLFRGTTGSTPVSGAGTRMMWIPDKAAFRVGEVTGTHWDADSIGTWSFVGGGYNNIASDYYTFVGGGWGNTASAFYSFVGGGQGNTASSHNSFVGGGSSNTASGSHSFMGGGFNNTGSGSFSFVGGGRNLLARSYGEAAFGTFNTDYTPASATSFNAADRLFVIGNGTAINSRSNAVTVLKNGRVGIGNAASTPGYLLDVAGTLNLNKSISSGIALRVNETEALWYDGTYFSWGFGGEYNRFADPVRIGSAAVPTHTLEVDGTAAKTDGTTWSVLSDARLKTVKGPYLKGLEAIGSLKPIRFNYNNDNPHRLDAETEQIGFIAQEVQPIFPEAVTMLKDGYLSFNMHSINVALVNAVKELKEENDILKAEVVQLNSRLTTENKTLRSEIENLKKLEGQLAKITSALTELGVNPETVP